MPDLTLRRGWHVKAACDDICRIAARATQAQIAVILEYSGPTGAMIWGAVGSNVEKLGGNAAIPELNHEERQFVAYDDLEHAPWFKNYPLHTILPYASGLVAVSIGTTERKISAALVVLNPHPLKSRNAGTAAELSELSRIAGFMLSSDRISEAKRLMRVPMSDIRCGGSPDGFQETTLSRDPGHASERDPLASFLFRTLISRRGLRSRKTVHYVTLRCWKQSVKDTQIAAFRFLKSQLPRAAVAAIAEELANATRELYAGLIFVAVVPVPCGSSGHEQCLSVLLAEEVARLLGIPCKQVLMVSTRPGVSHPRKSARLPKFTVHGEISGQVLLIDDVASTGTHIEHSVKALRASGATPLAIAWIGS